MRFLYRVVNRLKAVYIRAFGPKDSSSGTRSNENDSSERRTKKIDTDEQEDKENIPQN
ncbi:hypothetical protein ACFL2D_00310 [Patescibacteria group bacterium]